MAEHPLNDVLWAPSFEHPGAGLATKVMKMQPNNPGTSAGCSPRTFNPLDPVADLVAENVSIG
jgi:hypothetical protein